MHVGRAWHREPEQWSQPEPASAWLPVVLLAVLLAALAAAILGYGGIAPPEPYDLG